MENQKAGILSLRNKFVVFIVVFGIGMFISGLFYGKAYAFTTDAQAMASFKERVNNMSHEMGGSPYYVLGKSTDGYYYGYACKQKMYYDQPGEAMVTPVIGDYVYYYRALIGADSFSYVQGNKNSMPLRTGTTPILSNYNVYKSDGTTVFFSLPKAPILSQIPLQQFLPKVTVQILGILPILLAFLVGFLGLRKALATLSQILHQA